MLKSAGLKQCSGNLQAHEMRDERSAEDHPGI
jgi:hypothetical protein